MRTKDRKRRVEWCNRCAVAVRAGHAGRCEDRSAARQALNSGIALMILALVALALAAWGRNPL